LTDCDRGVAEAFVEQFGVPWPCGYGAPLEALARFGAYSTRRMSSTYSPNQEVSPTLYLIGPDGRVVWHDDQARPRHRVTPEAVVRQAEAAIEAELAGGIGQ
jgi:hypothetical protein